jgi:uncharacterized DUF497 family protein
MSRYTWDRGKAAKNLRKHGVTFEEATEAAAHPLAVEQEDSAHSDSDARLKVIGWSPRGRLLVVIVSTSGRNPQIISAWRATKRERDAYTN